MSDLLGNDFKLYIDSASTYAGTWGSPTWVEMSDIGDLGRDHAPERVEIKKRIAFKVYKMGRKDLTFTFTLNINPSDAACTAIIAAIESGGKVHFAIANGPIATIGTIYWHAYLMLVGPEDFAIDDAATIDVEGKPHADDTNIPAKVTVAS